MLSLQTANNPVLTNKNGQKDADPRTEKMRHNRQTPQDGKQGGGVGLVGPLT